MCQLINIVCPGPESIILTVRTQKKGATQFKHRDSCNFSYILFHLKALKTCFYLSKHISKENTQLEERKPTYALEIYRIYHDTKDAFYFMHEYK